MRRFASIASGLFACVTGCGDDGGARKLPDAPVADDAPVDTITAGDVNVTAFARCCEVAANTPQESVLVVAVLADGTVASTAMTNAQGQATLTGILPGTTVTAVYPEDTDDNVNVTSYVGVKPGDSLRVGEAYYSLNPVGADGTMNLTWPAVTDATWYYAYTPCQYGVSVAAPATTMVLSQYVSCQTPTAPILVLAYGNNGLLATAYLPAAPFTNAANVTLTAAQWIAQPAAPNVAVSITGVDAANSYLELSAFADFPVFTVDGSQSLTPKAGAASTMLSLSPNAPRLTGRAYLNRNGSDGEHNYHKAGPSPIAFATPSLPWIDGVIVSVGEIRAIWLQSSGSYDAATLELSWSSFEPKNDRYFRWNIIIPPGVNTLELGAPPAELADFLPNATADVSYELTLVDLSSTSDYDAVRALPEWRVMSPRSAVREGDEPAAYLSSFDGGEGFTD